MYAHFYHLSENPFNLTPDPKFHYINESTREALASVLYGIKSRKGFLTLIGEAGTGKTTLLRRIVDEIEGETRVVFVFNPGVSFDELLEYLCMELGIRSSATGRLHLIEKLNQFLLEQLTDGRNVVVIIDEAQTLDDGVLEELRMLSNLETSKEKILQIVLSGQPELEEKLRKPNLRQLRQRIGVRATLKPMRSDEIRAYVETRLRSAGGQKAELFTTAALLRCWKASQGIPRVINVICDNAMMVAFAEGSDRITVSVMNAAIRDLDGLSASGSWMDKLQELLSGSTLRYGALAAAVLVAAFVLGREVGWNGGAQAPPVPAQVASAPASSPSAAQAAPEAAAPTPPSAAGAVPAAPAAGVEETAEGAGTVTAQAQALPQDTAVPPSAAVEGGADSGDSPSRQAPPAPVGASGGGVPPAVGSVSEGLRTTATPAESAYETAASADRERVAATDPALRDSVQGSHRRAQEKARLTAARLYGTRADPLEEGFPVDSPEAQEALRAAQAAEEVQEARLRAQEEARLRQAAEEAAAAEAAALVEVARAAEAAAEPEPDPVVPARALPAEAPPSVAAPPTGLADGLESVASLSSEASQAPKSVEKGVMGRHVRVARGDTVWAIAMQYYGTVDSGVLTEIFRHNPGIRNAHQLPVGSDVFVPFLKPEHMVDPVKGGGYRVLVAESPKPGEIDKAEAWAASRLPGRPLTTVDKGRDSRVRTVYATGFTGRDAALAAARQLLGPSSQ